MSGRNAPLLAAATLWVFACTAGAAATGGPDLDKLVNGLSWDFFERVSTESGTVSPTGWPSGTGVAAYFKYKSGVAPEQKYHMAVWLMDRRGGDPLGPLPKVTRSGHVVPARFIGQTDRVRVYLSRGPIQLEADLVKKLGLTPADSVGGAKIANDLQLVLKCWGWCFEAGEQVHAVVEFRYLGPAPSPEARERHTSAPFTLTATHEGKTPSCTLYANRLSRLLPMRAEEPSADWFSVNLNKHLDLSEPGRYELRGACRSGAVLSNPLTIVINPPAAGLQWSPAAGGLRLSARVADLDHAELRIQNVSKQPIPILLLGRRGLTTVAACELVGPAGELIEAEKTDRSRDIESLKFAARIEQPGDYFTALEPGEVQITLLPLNLRGQADAEGHRLTKYDPKQPQSLPVTYDTRPYVELVQKIRHGQDIWTGVLTSPAVPLPKPQSRE